MGQLPLVDLGWRPQDQAFGDNWGKVRNCHHVLMCTCEFFNPILQMGGGLHEEICPKGCDESLKVIVQFLFLKLKTTLAGLR